MHYFTAERARLLDVAFPARLKNLAIHPRTDHGIALCAIVVAKVQDVDPPAPRFKNAPVILLEEIGEMLENAKDDWITIQGQASPVRNRAEKTND